jgi:hypothetical protein
VLRRVPIENGDRQHNFSTDEYRDGRKKQSSPQPGTIPTTKF